MPTITFDGPNKIIDIGYDSAITTVSAVDIYSRWKDWVTAGNAQYVQAFDLSVGGNDLGGGASLDGYLFLRNDLGWRIRPADQDHILIMDGQLYGYSAGTAKYLTRSGRTINIQESQSSRSQVVQGGDPPSIAAAVWSSVAATFNVAGTMGEALNLAKIMLTYKTVTDPAAGTITVYDVDGTTVLFSAPLWQDAGGTIPYSGEGAERRERLQ